MPCGRGVVCVGGCCGRGVVCVGGCCVVGAWFVWVGAVW